jgi:hypothetical protein
MGKAKKQKIEITEMFVAKACPARVFWGIITRRLDENGNPVVFSRILMDDGLLCASAENQQILSKNLNLLAKLVCFTPLHEDHGVVEEIFGTEFFLN